MKLQFTNGYRPHFDQISRILQFLSSQTQKKKIPRSEIVAALGIPDKQIENLTSMMVGFGLVLPRTTVLTDFGRAVVQHDPYFEKIETLWAVHYMVSSNPEWVVWHRIITLAIPAGGDLSVEGISKQYFPDLAAQFSERTILEKLPKEIGAVLGAYTRTELARLNILESPSPKNYVNANPVPVTPLVLLFCLLYYRDHTFPGSTALEVKDICSSESGPGRVLNLPEYVVRSSLNQLHDLGLIRLEQFANLDQVRLSDDLTQANALARIYGSE